MAIDGGGMKMTSEMGLGALRRWGRRAPMVAVAALSLLLQPVPVSAQSFDDNWLANLFSSPEQRNRTRAPAKPAVEVVNDMREDSTPWRSDVMLQSIERAIQHYQKIVAAGGFARVPGGRLLRPGDDDERIPPLRKRLHQSGDYKSRSSSFSSYSYDGELEAAVRRFQERHGLRVSGRIDQPTVAALNVTAESRLAQLKLNYNRVAELMQQAVEDRYILVNVPAFQLEAVEKYEVVQRHRVIAGRTERQTPSLRATVKAINFFPYWRVPDSVAQLDLIPRVRKEPDYLVQEKIRVLNGVNGPELDPISIDWSTADASKIKFKQDPGPQNALGLVRIDMSNPEGVYMHDTPMKKLFEQRSRSFSAGCVRVQGVFKLVEWILSAEAGWQNPGRVQEVLDSGQAMDINLTRPIPVHFAYVTAWAEEDGSIQFRPDIYGRDGANELMAGLDRDPNDPPPPPQSLAP